MFIEIIPNGKEINLCITCQPSQCIDQDSISLIALKIVYLTMAKLTYWCIYITALIAMFVYAV